MENWEIKKEIGYDACIVCGDTEICNFIFSDVSEEELNLNMRVIAKAPQMLKLLQKMYENDDFSDIDDYSEACDLLNEILRYEYHKTMDCSPLTLKSLGEQGWELVCIHPNASLIFKRELSV